MLNREEQGRVSAPPDSTPCEVEALVSRVNEGDGEALHDLISLVQAELRVLARSTRRGWTPPPTLATTELISEAYLRLFGGAMPEIHDQKHFFCLAARTMRWVVLGHYQRSSVRPVVLGLDSERVASKPGVPDEVLAGAGDVAALDDALERLGASEPELARFVELRFFLGLQLKEISAMMNIPMRTLHRRWTRARAWLYREMRRGAPCDGEDAMERESDG